jgi:inhibitor of KinA sporulation pathway (predicted exonuclease)
MEKKDNKDNKDNKNLKKPKIDKAKAHLDKAHKHMELAKSEMLECLLEQTNYICILDFEATCWKENKNHEIIEFPSVLLKWNDDNKLEEVSRIQLFVKPLLNPTVSKFCNELTGITQEQVNNGIDLRTAITTHNKWLYNCGAEGKTTIVTCGHWDMRDMLPLDLNRVGMKAFGPYKKYVNIKDLFSGVTGFRGPPMTQMLDFFNLELEGRHHSGLDDCHNIARIFIKIVERGLGKTMFLDYIYQV